MPTKPQYARPTFEQALTAWKAFLKARALPDDLVWVFDENLCFEPDPASPGGFRLSVQTAFTPPPPDSDRIAYKYFADFDARIVFYRLGTSTGKSVCLMLCDEWFESKGEPQGFWRQDKWLVSFRPGTDETVATIADEERWKNRIIRNRPLHDLDFCMTLRAIHELLAHGRVLSTYERYGLKVLSTMRHLVPSHPTR
jgi:hypothetical protein